MITLAEISATLGPAWAVQGLGGNVYGVTDYVRTITIDEGATRAEAPAMILICEDGAELLRAEIHSAAEVGPLLATL